MTRRVPVGTPDTINLFAKYGAQLNQPLGQQSAVKLLCDRYGLTAQEAEDIRQAIHFTGDRKLSKLEYETFNNGIGQKARELMDIFNELKDGNPPEVDVNKLCDRLMATRKQDGSAVSEELLSQFKKNHNFVDLTDIINLCQKLWN